MTSFKLWRFREGESVHQSNHRDTLVSLLKSQAGPGFEEDAGERVRSAFLEYASEVEVDGLGNVIAKVSGAGDTSRPVILLSAHLDEIALMVTKIETGGFLRVAQTGGFDPRTLVSQEVWVHGRERLVGIVGSKPPHLTTDKERGQAPTLDSLFIDLAMSEEQVRRLVRVGDRITLQRDPVFLMNERISGKALDNRTSVAVLLECLRFLQQFRVSADIYLAATVQEETLMHGAVTLGHRLDPDVSIAVDVSFADMPGQDPDYNLKINKGPYITFGPNIHPKVFRRLRDTAQTHNIPFQVELTQDITTTEADPLQIVKQGGACGLVGIPLRYMHTSVETGSYDDVMECGRLLAHFVADLDTDFVEGLTCY